MKNTYLIIGGHGSIGNAVVEKLAQSGHNVYKTSRNQIGPNIISLDLTSNESINDLIKMNYTFDGIIFAAGYEPQQSLIEMTDEHQQRMIKMHLTGPINVIQKLISKINANGSIIFISSIAAYKGSYDPMYATVKGGVLSLTRTLAVELSKKQIRVNCIAPGLVENSTVYNGMTQDFKEKHINNTLNKKLATSEDCAETISFLLQQQHINGQVLHINGGQYFGN